MHREGQGRRYTFLDLPSGSYQVIIKSGKSLPEGLVVTITHNDSSLEDLGTHSFMGPGDALPEGDGRHFLGVTTLREDAATILINLTLSPWLCFPHFVNSLELYGPLKRGALEVVDPRWVALDGLDSSQFAESAVGRGLDGSALCVCSKFMCTPGYNDISSCSHSFGYHHCTQSGEREADGNNGYDQCGLLRRCCVLVNPHCYEWLPTTRETVASIQERGVPLSRDLVGNALFATRIRLAGDLGTVVPGRLLGGEYRPRFAVCGLGLTHDSVFELLSYKIVL